MDILTLRDAIIEGKDDWSVAVGEDTARASAQFHKYAEKLRKMARARFAEAQLKQQMTGVVLRDWQNQAVLDLDQYELCLEISLNVLLWTRLKVFIE